MPAAYGMTFPATYADPLRASMVPAGLKRAMAASAAYAVAEPCDSPTAASMSAPPGVASNCTVNAPVCAAKGVFDHPVDEVWQVPTGGGSGSATVTLAVPLFPSLVPVITAVPAATPRASPLPDTVTTPGALVAQLTLRPVREVPLASFGVAVSCTVCPTATLAVAGLTATDATGAGEGPDVVRLKLHTVWVPCSACTATLASAVTPLCSVRNASPVPIVCSALPGGVT